MCVIIHQVVNKKEYREVERKTFFGDKALEKFCRLLLSSAENEKFPKYSNSVVFSHYGSKFDNRFVLQCGVDSLHLYPKIVQKGNQLISLTFEKNIRFLDSFCFIDCALKKFS